MKSDIIIRKEKVEDISTVDNLIRESFWNVYRPGCLEHYVMHCIRKHPDFMPELNFVMEKNGEIIGQSVLFNAEISADDGRKIPIMTLGPICIKNELKRMVFGKILLDYSLERAKEAGAGAICFEGNILFYGKSGFSYASDFGIRYHGLPEGADSSFFLCKELISGYLNDVTGVYQTPSVYYVDENEAEEFDKNFPEKEKSVLPSQLV